MKTKNLKVRLSALQQQKNMAHDNCLRWASVYRVLESLIQNTTFKKESCVEDSMKHIREIYEKEEIKKLGKIQKEIEEIENQLLSQKSLVGNLIKLITKKIRRKKLWN